MLRSITRSLDDDLDAFNKRMSDRAPTANLKTFCEPKLDGLAVSLLSCQRHLVQAATRGDGATGENITGKRSRNIVARFRLLQGEGWPERIEVRGEAFMLKRASTNWMNWRFWRKARRSLWTYRTPPQVAYVSLIHALQLNVPWLLRIQCRCCRGRELSTVTINASCSWKVGACLCVLKPSN